MKTYLDICLSDDLPCSCSVKGVGIGFCVKNSRGKIIVCCRFSDVSLLERSIFEGAQAGRARQS